MHVLISSTGWEKDLTIRSAIKSKADKIILVTSEVKQDTPMQDIDKFVQNITKEIADELGKYLEVETLTVDYADYQDAFEKVSKIVRKEKEAGNKVQLNITEGSKLLAAAFMTVAFTHNIEVLYCIPQKYNFDLLPKGKPLREGIWKTVAISPLPAAFKISKKAKEILQMMENKEISVKDYIEKFHSKDENRARAEFNYYVDKLHDYGLIEITNGLKKKNCKISNTGRILLKSS